MNRYSPVTTAEFNSACIEQGVLLEDHLAMEAYREPHEPAYRLASVAGDVLRAAGVRMPLAYERIEDPVYPWDSTSCILRTIINASIEPTGPSEHIPYFAEHSSIDVNTCFYADTAFALTLSELQKGDFNKRRLSFGGEIFIDERGQAVAVRKNEGYSSGLALMTFNIGGIEFPEGSVLCLETSEHTQGYDILDQYRFVIRPMSDVVEAGFGRLSAFALPPEQRLLKHADLLKPDDAAYKLLHNLRPEEMQPLVQTAILDLAR